MNAVLFYKMKTYKEGLIYEYIFEKAERLDKFIKKHPQMSADTLKSIRHLKGSVYVVGADLGLDVTVRKNGLTYHV